MDGPLDEKHLRDLEIIKEELEPFVLSLEEKEIDMISLVMFLSYYIKELLKEIDNKHIKEMIIKIILD